eukprot:833698-Prymnesium_polylepis.1
MRAYIPSTAHLAFGALRARAQKVSNFPHSARLRSRRAAQALATLRNLAAESEEGSASQIEEVRIQRAVVTPPLLLTPWTVADALDCR